MTSNFALLNGAGYSKNWGGWLASELWSVILSHPLVQKDEKLKNIIWKYRKLGFEAVFGDKEISEHYAEEYQKIIKDSFIMMHRALTMDVDGLGDLFYKNFIHRFKAIFTLNQDLFFESKHPTLSNLPETVKYYYPYIKSSNYFKYNIIRNIATIQNSEIQMFDATLDCKAEPYDQTNDHLALIMSKGNQTSKLIKYYKLHGSLNFSDPNNSNIMVMGSSKPSQIEKIPLLKKYHEDFAEVLKNVKKLMVVGYSFTDYHINKHIFDAVEQGLKFWIVDVNNLDGLIYNAANSELKINKAEGSYIEIGEELKRARNYNNLFKKGLISNTTESLYKIFSGTKLELKRIEDNFFE